MAVAADTTNLAPSAFPDLAALRAGNDAAWTVAFHHLWPVALRAAQHPQAGLTSGEAEDAASEALAQLVPLAHRAANGDELKALAATIAYRRAVSMARHKSAAKRPLSRCRDEQVAGGDGIAELSDPGRTPADILALRDLLHLLHGLMAELDAETLALIEGKALNGFSYQELSKHYGLPLGTVCAKVARGLGKVRDALRKSPKQRKELETFLR